MQKRLDLGREVFVDIGRIVDYHCLDFLFKLLFYFSSFYFWDRRGRERMVVRFKTTYTISVYHHKSCEFESRSWRGGIDTSLCDKVCQSLATDWWFSPFTAISSTNKADRHNITEILSKVALNTITLTPDPVSNKII